MKNIAQSKKANIHGYYETVVDIISCDGEFIEYKVKEYNFLNKNYGDKRKGWKETRRSMLVEDFHHYFNVLDYDFTS